MGKEGRQDDLMILSLEQFIWFWLEVLQFGFGTELKTEIFFLINKQASGFGFGLRFK